MVKLFRNNAYRNKCDNNLTAFKFFSIATLGKIYALHLVLIICFLKGRNY